MDKESQETWKLLDVQDTLETEDSKPNEDESPDPVYAERLNSALAAAEYGRFHLLLWAVCGGAHLSAALVPSVLRLHAAAVLCGLRLSEDDQFLANCATYAGRSTLAPAWPPSGGWTLSDPSVNDPHIRQSHKAYMVVIIDIL
ncbi:uncharacterized protein LOC134533549 [Bacillus rossius redtenbacheri]|uniref:uncharacterized protein LOC134533549 n=1 Tax=Bacillus rossius redtenbacheri TaxID=93214 RepID=UPI002FDD2148